MVDNSAGCMISSATVLEFFSRSSTLKLGVNGFVLFSLRLIITLY